MPSKRMMDDKIPAVRENVPSQMSSIATATHRNQEKKEKRKRKKSKVTKRLCAGEQSLGVKILFFFYAAKNSTLYYIILLLSVSNFSFFTLLHRCIIQFLRKYVSSFIHHI
jgi:hypothetical protein